MEEEAKSSYEETEEERDAFHTASSKIKNVSYRYMGASCNNEEKEIYSLFPRCSFFLASKIGKTK
ncbi:Uncharacterized protein APZ42_016746 [Daphnia magna]|uniref:Uncharacterized protein n=1 Tax=Daphnia magna TaxID=35525 RepID=A0A165A3Z8_9CRUS|nr:Uncharacterized protein APZ42_016746 [Daphnia magna]